MRIVDRATPVAPTPPPPSPPRRSLLPPILLIPPIIAAAQAGVLILLQGLGSEWQDFAPEELRTKLGLAVRQLKSNWRLGALLLPIVAHDNDTPCAA